MIKYIEEKKYVSWGELVTNLGMTKKMLTKALQNVELSTSINSKRKFFTLRKQVIENKDPQTSIWETNGKVFSAIGNLNDAILHIVRYVPNGIDERTLSSILKTPARNILKELKDDKKIKAVSFEGRTVYFSPESKRFSKQFPRRLQEENCEEIQITFEEFFKTLCPEIKHIAEELVPEELRKASNINYKEFVKLLLAEPKLTYTSDRHMARHLQNSARMDKLIKTEIKGHSAISKYKDLLTVDFYVKMFEFLVEKVLEFTNLKEVTILVDATVNPRYKRDLTHYRCHTAIIAELKCPIAMIVTKGKVHESPVFQRILAKIQSLKVKVKYVICDAGYDSAKVYVHTANKLRALCIIPTRDMKDGSFDRDTFQLSLDYYFESIFKNDIFEEAATQNMEKAGSHIRELVDAVKKLDWWKEIYKMRTGVERFFSWVKGFLGLTMSNKYNLKQVARHAYQIFSFTVAQALCALKMGIEHKTASFRSFIL
ncbi:MAG: transposase [Nanoarchaeota archaeon]